MSEKPLAKLEELEKRIEALRIKAGVLKEYKARTAELEQQVKAFTDALAREKAARAGAEKAQAESVAREKALAAQVAKAQSEKDSQARELAAQMEKAQSENASQADSLKAELEKIAAARLAEADAKHKKLEDKLAREKKLREDLANRVHNLIGELEGEKEGK